MSRCAISSTTAWSGSRRRLDSTFEFKDLVVDDETGASLQEIVGALRERRKVREHWGFRGAAGVSVLFSGDPEWASR